MPPRCPVVLIGFSRFGWWSAVAGSLVCLGLGARSAGARPDGCLCSLRSPRGYRFFSLVACAAGEWLFPFFWLSLGRNITTVLSPYREQGGN